MAFIDLGMNNAGASAHALNIACVDHSAVAHGIPMI